jgi:hypothetical protein
MREDVDSHYYESNKHKMLPPLTVAENIPEMVFDAEKYGNGISVDLPSFKMI